MFDPRAISEELTELRHSRTPSALVFDTRRDFEILPPSVAENLLPVVDSVHPRSYDDSWVPSDAPEPLHRIVREEFTIGAPGDGGVAWTRQTTPPIVFVKPRLAGSPAGFIDFLIAEALVEISLDIPEHFIEFFGSEYRTLADAVPLSPADTYQLAAALFDAYAGRLTRPLFAEWADEYPTLHAEWADAGERLTPRLNDLSRDVAIGRTGFSDAAELACSAVKHDLDPPTPFAALDTAAYEQYGSSFAVRWAEKTFDALDVA